MKFLSIVGLIEFTKLMEELGYNSSISITQIKKMIKKLPKYISQYTSKIDYMSNVVVLYLLDNDEICFEVIYEKA